ncbi:MAG: hypothetical protein WBW03_24955, partial [Silvibacterium sp.]
GFSKSVKLRGESGRNPKFNTGIPPLTLFSAGETIEHLSMDSRSSAVNDQFRLDTPGRFR